MKIAVITNNFPHPKFPQAGSFVHKLVDGMANAGANVTVYSLVSKTHLLFRRRQSASRLGEPLNFEVKHIEYFSFGNLSVGDLSSIELGYRDSMKRLQKRFISDISNERTPDVLYGKFLLSGGRRVVSLSREYSIPAVADLGESKLLENLTAKQERQARQIVKCLRGVVCVSPRLASEVIELGMNPDRVLMLPNGIDADKFYPVCKKSAREALGFPLDKKIVIFVGHFIHRKGPDRVLKAIQLLPPEYCGVFLGEGSVTLASDRILFKGRVPNDDLNILLNTADVFCLPTLAEGSCNAIEEARAVGLPIVTSNIPDITDFESAQEYTLIDPLDYEEISRGIREACEKGTSEYRKAPLSNDIRSKTIVEWLAKIIQD